MHAIGMQLSLPRDLAKTPFLKADQQQKEKKKKASVARGKNRKADSMWKKLVLI